MTDRDSHMGPAPLVAGDVRSIPAALRPQTPEAFEQWGELMLRDRIVAQRAARERAHAIAHPQPELPLADAAMDEHAKLRDAGFFG